MAGLPIPADWDEQTDGYCVMSFTVPNSPRWRTHLRGAIYTLTQGHIWDEETGDPNQAAQTSRDIWDSYTIDCGP